MITVNLDYDTVAEVFKKDLKDQLETLSSDFGKVVISGKGHVFSTYAAEDAKQLKKLMKAMVRVHNWYAPFGEHLEIKDYV